MDGKGPIFVAGLDRSGTSLIYAILSSHPNISMVRRTNMWRYFYRRFGDLGQKENFERCLNSMLRYKRLVRLKPDEERLRREFWQGEPTYGRLFALFHEHTAERREKPRWGDKSLHTERYTDQVFAEYPNAKIIHMVRDPRDRYASALKRYSKNRGKAGAATARWLVSVIMAKRNMKRYPKNYRIMRYESLVLHPEESLHELCEFIEEEYTVDMLTMVGAPDHRDKGGNSSFGKFEPGVISSSPIGRYKKVLSIQDIAFIQPFAGRHMKELGYQLEPIRFSFREWSLRDMLEWSANFILMLAWTMVELFREKSGYTLPARRLINHSIAKEAPSA